MHNLEEKIEKENKTHRMLSRMENGNVFLGRLVGLAMSARVMFFDHILVAFSRDFLDLRFLDSKLWRWQQRTFAFSFVSNALLWKYVQKCFFKRYFFVVVPVLLKRRAANRRGYMGKNESFFFFLIQNL